MRKFMYRLGILLLTVAVFVMGVRLPAFAKTQPRWQSLSAEAGAAFVTALGNVKGYQDFRKSLSKDFAPDKNLLVVERDKHILVTIPLTYKGRSEQASSFTAIFDPATKKPVATFASVVEDTAEGHHHAKMYRDGTLTTDLIIDDAGTIVSGWVEQQDGSHVDLTGKNFVEQGREKVKALQADLQAEDKTIFGNSLFPSQSVAQAGVMSCINACLGAAGIAGWVLSLLTAACSFPCNRGWEWTCQACIASTYFILASTIAACVGFCIASGGRWPGR